MWENHTPDVLNPQGAAALAAMFPAPEYNIGAPASFEQNGGKRSQAMLAVDAIFRFKSFSASRMTMKQPR
jgi:hypothetical protein